MRGRLLVTTLLSALALQATAAPATARPARQDGAAVPLCPARAGWASLTAAGAAALRGGRRILNLVQVAADGGLTWNGAPVDPVTLGQYFYITSAMTPRPVLVLSRARGASCAAVAAVAASAERHLACTPDLCKLAAGARFPGASPPPPPAPPAPPRR